MTKMIKKWITLALLLIPVHASALTVMAINTEWLWDSVEPHEGRIIGEKEPAPTKRQYKAELGYYAGLIQENQAKLVGLVELEGCHVAQDLADSLGAGWESICQKGRDTFTAQDVALLFHTDTFRTVTGSKTTFPDHYAMNGQKKVRPSKVLSVMAKHRATGENYLVTAIHLVSKRNPKNEAKRHAQAAAVKSGIASMNSKYDIDHHIILGDVNDYPGSKTLETLKSDNLINPADVDDCSYVYRGQCNLIDHILLSDGIAGGELVALDVPKKYSDHKALVYKK